MWDLKRDIVYKNDEMYNLMRALDIEDNIERLRYDRVIPATEADADGLHIRNLLITYFFKFFEGGRAQAPRARRPSLRARDAALPRCLRTAISNKQKVI